MAVLFARGKAYVGHHALVLMQGGGQSRGETAVSSYHIIAFCFLTHRGVVLEMTLITAVRVSQHHLVAAWQHRGESSGTRSSYYTIGTTYSVPVYDNSSADLQEICT